MTTIIKNNGNGRNLIFPQFPSLFDDFLTKDFINHAPKADSIPAVNIKESDTSFSIELAAPGMDKNNFKIELKNNILTVSSQTEKKTEEKTEEDKFIRKEFAYKSFTRTFTLPEKSVEENNITANYTNGILSILIPKKEKEKIIPVKEITIS